MAARALVPIDRRLDSSRDRTIFLLSLRAGLRAAEIAGLRWSMVVTSSGKLGSAIAIEDHIAKAGSGRVVPMHRELREALRRLGPSEPGDPVIVSAKTGEAMTPGSVVNWFRQLYAELGAVGCSSHSGRRTFVTMAARRANQVGASLRDVQLLAGHRSIEVTQRYIDSDTAAQRRLVSSL